MVRATLKAEREATTARIAAMTADFDEIVATSLDMNGDDEHDPEGSTIAYERAQVAALLSEAQGALEDLDLALARVAEGTYGRCEGCGGRIATERLSARPATRTCIGCASSAHDR
jgi:DnaK suppressor protein